MEKDRKHFISLIIPAYRQEKTIIENIKYVKKSLSSLPFEYEIIVVVDGFPDKTYEKAKSIKDKRVKIVGYDRNFGKGYAIRYGAKYAKGDIIGFIDAGMDIDSTGFSMLLNHMWWYNADIIVGSKLHPVSQVNYPVSRKILSWVYRTLTHFMFGFKVRDTQVGFKIFRKSIIKNVFPKLLVKKFAFDIEILAVSYALGYKRIYEAPIKLNFKENSITSKNFWKIILPMLWDTFAVFYRLRVLRYYKKDKK